LQLAHYRRLLETAGLASTGLGHNVGGICGSEGVVVWYDLDAPVLEAPEHVDVAGLPRRISPMERYDLEFAMRLRVSVAAELHLDDPSEELLAEPIVCKDCAMCRWREWCGSQLEAVADLSLVSGVGVGRRRLYMEHGVSDLYALAGLDWTTAELVRRGVDLTDLKDRVREGALPGATPLASIIPKRKKQLEDLAALGFVTAGDLAALDGPTFVLGAAGGSSVASQIELARARVGQLPAYRRRDVVAVEVPRADIEVDVDMESTNDGCYLWGALATDRREPGAEGAYLSFATWDPDIEEGELAAFEKFWSWLRAVRARAAAAGATFRAYCYSRSAEEGQMKRLADRLGLRDEVDAFLLSDEWVDLLEVVRGQLVTGRSMGLKETAPLAGFAWRFDDAGGTLAMVKYDEAVDEGAADGASRQAAAQWILDYNEDDVRATAALRAWLDGAARMLPSIASWDGEGRSAA
jgi:predicted RecB family nuclease